MAHPSPPAGLLAGAGNALRDWSDAPGTPGLREPNSPRRGPPQPGVQNCPRDVVTARPPARIRSAVVRTLRDRRRG
eukprot:14301494-Alexandrium_andersonii.AAC.1